MISYKSFILSVVLLFTSFIYAQDVQMGFGSVDDSYAEITISTTSDVAGFQFDVQGASLSGASGGLAADSGFTVSTGGQTVLGFSFSGSVIPAGSDGVLTNLLGNFSDSICLSDGTLADSSGSALEYSFGEFDCDFVDDCVDEDADGICDDVDDCVGEYDECGVCNGSGASECWDGSSECDPSNCPDQPSGDVELGFGSIGDTSMEIVMSTPQDVAGFQFNVEGTLLSGASGGLASDAGFTVSVGGNTVLGFSFTGSVIPAGSSGVLTNLVYTAEAEEACLDNVVVSNGDGQSLDTNISDCADLDFEEPCDDEDADGICDDVDDCVGEFDECGVCNGDGIADGACDCDGNVEDCAGECGGDAVVDDCGVCGGDGSSCSPVYLGFGSIGDDSLEILISNPCDVAEISI